MSDKNKTVISYIGLFGVAMIWGLAFSVVKTTLDYVPPVYMVAIRFSIASVFIALVFFRKFRHMNKQNTLHGIIIGVFLFLAYLTQTLGCKYTTAGKNAFLTALYVIIVPFLHWIISKKRPKIRLFIAAFIGIVAIGLISLDGIGTIGTGDALTIACSVLFALQIAFIDKYTGKDDPVILTMWQVFVCAVLGWITAPFIHGALTADIFRLNVIGGLFYIGVFSSLICSILQTVCQKYTKPENASLIMCTESVFGALGSFILLHEVMSVKTLAGCVLMFGAIVLSQIKMRGDKQ